MRLEVLVQLWSPTPRLSSTEGEGDRPVQANSQLAPRTGIFNVALIGSIISSLYVQSQLDSIPREFHDQCGAYINDVTACDRILQSKVKHLDQIFHN